MSNDEWIPISHENCEQVAGPFYHGTKARLALGDLLSAGQASNFEEGRVSNHIYFSALLDAAIWGTELAMALAGMDGRGHIYVVEPTGPFEDDPNVTNKRFPGNPTRSYRTREPLRIVGTVEGWDGHPPEVLQGMLDSLEKLKRDGIAVIGIVTNGSSRSQRAKLENSGLLDRVDAHVISGEFGKKKPDEAIYDEITRRLDIDPRKSWFLGDDPVADIWGPAQLGFKTGWVERYLPWPDDLSRCYTRRFSQISEVRSVLADRVG